MRRTLSVVLSIVNFYNVRMINLLPIKTIAGKKLKRNNNIPFNFATTLNQKRKPKQEISLLNFQNSLRIKSVLYFTTTVSLFCIFEHYKPINRNCHETDAFNRPYHCYLLQC